MTNKLKLMAVLAHPDDESLGNGGILARYAAEGVETYLVTATRRERGWTGSESDYPGSETLGKRREAELLAAAQVLGIRRVEFLDYLDGDLDQTPAAEAVAKIVLHLRRVQPDVVVTFGPDGAYGHPDHIAVVCPFHLQPNRSATPPTAGACSSVGAISTLSLLKVTNCFPAHFRQDLSPTSIHACFFAPITKMEPFTCFYNTICAS